MLDVSHDVDHIIHVLPVNLANKIAAGEVVQRPASVLKELVENSLDAGASQIDVILKSAGSELIQVIDNGCGMSPADAVRSLQRHATSKIQSQEDLERIHTLGFRGEALASIGAVAHVVLRTKRKHDEAGVEVKIEGGKTQKPVPSAAPDGTSIAVRNLFFNVPARRNFLKSTATELKHLLETFQFLALSNPENGFSLVHDDSEVYRLRPRTGDKARQLQERIVDLFGDRHLDNLVPVTETTSYLSLHGFAGKPEFSRKSRGDQFMFVNGRYISNRYLEHAVANGYGEMLPKGSYPFFALFLTLDPRHVDVNVHPAKAEVKFADDRGVYGFVRAVVRKSLGVADITPSIEYDGSGRLVERRGDAPARGAAGPADYRDAAHIPPGVPARGGFPFKDPGPVFNQREMFGVNFERVTRDLYSGEEDATLPGSLPQIVPSEKSEEGEHSGRTLWQLHEKYILSRIRSGLMILDQHAAHERILYERCLRAMESGFGMSQQLLFPHRHEFGPADHGLLKELMPDLKALGFDLDLFSGRSVLVRGVPTDIRIGNERTILEEVLEQYKRYRDTQQLRGRDNLARSLACQSAIKTGQRLSVPEMQALIDQLFACEMPYACPHGRPTMVKISIDELDRRFGRVGHLERE